MNRWQKLKASVWRWVFSYFPTAIPSFPPAPLNWGQTERQQLSNFLESVTGRRFLNALRNHEYRNALFGADNQLNYTHAAGRTAGCGEMIRFIESLSAKPLGRNTVANLNNGVGTSGESLHDEPETEESLLARLSP